MRNNRTIRTYLAFFMLAIAGILTALSISIHNSPLDIFRSSHSIAQKLERQLIRLDKYADKVEATSTRFDDWADLSGMPEEMVIYKYVADTLHSWYNLFSVGNDDIQNCSEYQRITDPRARLSSPLAQVGEIPSYVNYGSKWYLVKSRVRGQVRIIEGLEVKAGRKFDYSTLSEGDGVPVFIGDEPVFKISVSQAVAASDTLTSGYFLRWLALVLLVVAILLYLTDHRSVRVCGISAALIIILAFIGREMGTRLIEFNEFFSPILYAQGGLLNSFGTLVIFNLAIFLDILCFYMCRDTFAKFRKIRRNILVSVSVLVTLLLLFYIFYSFASLIFNSSINLDLYRLPFVEWYTLIAYLSYGLLMTALLLCMELSVYLAGEGNAKRFTFLTVGWLFLFAVVGAGALGATSAALGLRKEQSRMLGLSNRLAVDRDLGMEIELRRVENDMAADPVLMTFSHMDNAEQLLARRLDEMYFARVGRNFDISVETSRELTPALAANMETLVSEGSLIGPDSRFVYNYSPSGSRYTGFFNYYSEELGMAILIIKLTPKVALPGKKKYEAGAGGLFSVNLPPIYSFARYYESKLVSFQGNFAYPTVLEGLLYGERGERASFVRKNYRHFVNHINADETIVITRRERNAFTYFITYTYIVLLLFLLLLMFRPRLREDLPRHRKYFSNRMRRLVVVSLVLTMIVMAIVSVIFVYQRNQRNLNNMMSAKISSIQLLLGGECRAMSDSEQMLTPDFASVLRDISSSTDSDINLYTPQGKLLLCSSPDIRERLLTGSRLEPEAFRSIILSHQRYCILKQKGERRMSHNMYAPIFNGAGNTIAIASSPYLSRDYDFTRDAIFHAATIISLFLILMLITVLLFSSITKAIFRPLLVMGQKMKGKDADSLEQIDYDGDDEISSLVGAYNDMVTDLRESTRRLASAERDKAWSAMARQVAHEIKNPLTPIKLEIQRLERLKMKGDPSWEEKFDQVSKIVLEHIDILSQTATEFSTFAKLYTEPAVRIDLDSVLKDQVLLFSGRENLELTYLGLSDAIVYGPRPQLIRVFVNLLTNALQAVEGVRNPKVTVSLRRSSTPDSWDIVFEDNGPGVSEENLSKLFTPNFTTKSSGTGLGLAICRSIVDKCGGEISYSRSFTLSGACFTVTLPSEQNEINTI